MSWFFVLVESFPVLFCMSMLSYILSCHILFPVFVIVLICFTCHRVCFPISVLRSFVFLPSSCASFYITSCHWQRFSAHFFTITFKKCVNVWTIFCYCNLLQVLNDQHWSGSTFVLVQWKRAGPITPRSMDQNHSLLIAQTCDQQGYKWKMNYSLASTKTVSSQLNQQSFHLPYRLLLPFKL